MRRQPGLTPGAPLVASSVLVVLLAGCSSESTQPLPPGPLVNDTPAHALQLFATVYGEQDLGDYSALLTGDFHAAFSATTDPDLVEIFGTTWRRADEIAATRHLFDGFLDETGTPMPGLSSLVVSLRSTQLILDPNHPDSVAHYVVAQVDTIEFTARAASTGSNDPFRFLASHRFWFVRGDAAVLDSTQAPVSTRWYLRRWEDRETYRTPLAFASPGARHTTADLVYSWSRVKVDYLR